MPDLGSNRGVLALTAAKVAFLAVLAGVVYYWRPLFHGFAYAIRYNPPVTIALGTTIVVGVLVFLAPPLDENSVETKTTAVGSWFVIVLVIGVCVAFAGSFVGDKEHATQTMERSDAVETLPEMDADNPRITPRVVADKQTRGSVSYRKYQLGTSDIVRGDNGSLVWSYAAEPEGLRNSIVEEQDGVVTAELTTMSDRDIRTVRTDMKYGEGMTVGSTNDSLIENRNVRWKILKGDYWVKHYDDARPFINDGEPYLYYPKTGHDVDWLPLPHRTVTWEGGALVHANGTIEHLSPEEARNHEVLEGQPLFPYYNTEERLTDIGYRNGIINAMIEHEDQVERADVPDGAGNSQPFVIDIEDGPISYSTAMEPYGEDTRALDEVWFTNSRTGNFTVYSSGSENLIGPERAMGIARGTDTQTGWASNSEGGNFRAVEPIPVVIDGELWWHIKVVPISGTDVTRNILVHASADDGRTAELRSTDEVTSFLDGENVSDVATNESDNAAGGETAPGGDDTAYVVVVRNEDGEVIDTIPIEDGESVSVEMSEAVSNGTATG